MAEPPFDCAQGRLDETQAGKLYDFNARFFTPVTGRFISPDSIVPNPADPQSLNRYTAMANNPLKFTDPSGHMERCECDGNGYNPVSLHYEWTRGWHDRASLRTAFRHYYQARPARALPAKRADARGSMNNAYNESAQDGKRDAEAEAGYLSEESARAFSERLEDLSAMQGDNNRAGMSLIMVGQARMNVASQFGPSRFGPTECSFAGDTPVATDEGAVAISAMVTGTKVLAWDEATNTTGYYPVTHLWAHNDPVIVLIQIDGETITTTPEHPFYTSMHGWLPADELWVGVGLRRADGSAGIVESTMTVTRTERMWNLAVERAHTYFIGDRAVLVHNDCLTGSNGRRYPRDYQVTASEATSTNPKTVQKAMGPFNNEVSAREYGKSKIGADPVRVDLSKWRNQAGDIQLRTENATSGYINLETLHPDSGKVLTNIHLYWERR